MKIEDESSSNVLISFSGTVNHPRHRVKARHVKGDARDSLSSIFKDNPHLPPSVQYRNDLHKLDGTSFASGNLTGESVSKMAYQKIASDTRCKANSVES